MKQETVRKICDAWEAFDDDDISTPTLLEMVRSEVGLQDVGDVVTGLIKGGLLKEQKDGCE